MKPKIKSLKLMAFGIKAYYHSAYQNHSFYRFYFIDAIGSQFVGFILARGDGRMHFKLIEHYQRHLGRFVSVEFNDSKFLQNHCTYGLGVREEIVRELYFQINNYQTQHTLGQIKLIGSSLEKETGCVMDVDFFERSPYA